MLLEEMRWEEMEAYLKKDDRIVWPIGSTEQHGTRGLLGTDFIVPETIAREVAKRAGVVCAPTMPFGMAEHHMAFPGTVSLRPSVYHMVVKEILRSFHHHGFRRVMILNGHGGNIAPMQGVLSETCNEMLDLRVQFHSWWTVPETEALVKELFGAKEGSHGTPGEVSITMFARPHVKFPEKVKIGGLNKESVFINREMARKMSPTGLYGASDPNLATAEHGKRLFERAVAAFTKRLGEWE